MTIPNISSSISPEITPFSGFIGAPHLLDILQQKHNSALKDLTVELFKKIKHTHVNEHPTTRDTTYEITDNERFLDAFAYLLMGDETCAAIVISESDIFIASNKGEQDLRSFSYKLTGTFNQKGSSVIFTPRCTIAVDNKSFVIKDSSPIECTLDDANQMLIAPKEKNEILFEFEKGEIPGFTRDRTKINFNLRKTFPLSTLGNINYNEEISLLDAPAYIGKLNRLAMHIFERLFRISTNEQHSPQALERDVKQLMSVSAKMQADFEHTHPNICPPIILLQELKNYVLGYIESCKEVNYPPDKYIFIKLYLNLLITQTNRTLSKEEKESHIYLAGCGFDSYYSYPKDKETLESFKEWRLILTDGLTPQLLKETLSDDQYQSEKIQLNKIYEDLIENYFQYKKNQSELITRIDSIKNWLNSIDFTGIELPASLNKTPNLFSSKVHNFLTNFAFIETHIKQDTFKNGQLSQIIQKTGSIKDSNICILSGDEGIHAEMRLLSHYLDQKMSSKPSYYGISKLCCVLCHYTFKQFQEAGIDYRVRGASANLFAWPFPKMLLKEERMKIFLGDALYNNYLNLKTGRLKSPKSGDYFDLKEVFVKIIEKLDSINNSEKLYKYLKLEKDIFPSLPNLYAPDMFHDSPEEKSLKDEK